MRQLHHLATSFLILHLSICIGCKPHVQDEGKSMTPSDFTKYHAALRSLVNEQDAGSKEKIGSLPDIADWEKKGESEYVSKDSRWAVDIGKGAFVVIHYRNQQGQSTVVSEGKFNTNAANNTLAADFTDFFVRLRH